MEWTQDISVVFSSYEYTDMPLRNDCENATIRICLRIYMDCGCHKQ